jgi:uncharacterized protein YjiS (DUF1127 family)
MTSIDMAGVPAATKQPDLFTRLRAALAARKIQRQTFKELSLLSDRELNDIGISRCDIRRIAAEAKA